MTPSDPQAKLHDVASELAEHVSLLRDYATTPGNVWLARGELGRIQELAVEIEKLLEQIKTES
ncbi:MAG TPA: hypothetical protein VLF21_00185 [Candidatus Saccharimonadales bacterium]|nr:hypothetical protein [Candidatus Saccharimonadales bacterium]